MINTSSLVPIIRASRIVAHHELPQQTPLRTPEQSVADDWLSICSAEDRQRSVSSAKERRRSVYSARERQRLSLQREKDKGWLSLQPEKGAQTLSACPAEGIQSNTDAQVNTINIDLKHM
jgi:hypothetical protein